MRDAPILGALSFLNEIDIYTIKILQISKLILGEAALQYFVQLLFYWL